MPRHDGIAVLGPDDLPAFLELCRADPVVNVFAEYRARTTTLQPRWLGGEMLGRFDDGRLVAACHVAANLVPVECAPEDAEAFAAYVVRRPRVSSTIFGPQDAVEAFWSVVGPRWGHPREFRWRQVHLELDRPSPVPPDPCVRRSVRADFDRLYPACVAMYTEEVGVSPEVPDSDAYRARVLQLVSRGWSFARYGDDRLEFKAEVGSLTSAAAQIQGVWVPPALRGQGLATAGMAAVSAYVHADLAPVASLYVNEWNTAALATYRAVGFRETAQFATILF